MLAWSFNRDGEAAPGLVEERDKKMNTDSMKKRQERADLAAGAKPQSGVDDLKGKFSRLTRDIPGVNLWRRRHRISRPTSDGRCREM